ncbi:MAG: hypothetical protein M3Y72_01215 [Acidobacteriota bacterium]|nr:hypothetical protein [Acidobacteriota bacterium]
MSAKEQNRCWPGYEPVAGKKPNSQGSCRPKADSKSTPSEKQFKAKRKRQLDEWQKEHPGKRRQAAQHLSGPDGEPSSQRRATKKKASTKKTAAAKKTTARKSSAKAKTAPKRTAKKQAA